MYGHFGKLTAQSGKRSELAAILSDATQNAQMPGCQLYLISLSQTNDDEILISEIWDDDEAHKNSLELPAIREAIGKARSLIAGMEGQATQIVGGWPAIK